MKKAGGILILLLVTMGLDGCLLRMGSPCAGFGCPAFAPRSSAQLQQAPAQNAQHASHHHFHPFGHKAQEQSDSASAPAVKSGQ